MEILTLEGNNKSANVIINKIDDLFGVSLIKIFEDSVVDNKRYQFVGCDRWNSCICIRFKYYGLELASTVTIYPGDIVHFYDEKIDIYRTEECFDCMEKRTSYVSIHKSSEIVFNDRFILTDDCNKKDIIEKISTYNGKNILLLSIESNQIGNMFGSNTDFIKMQKVSENERGLIVKCDGNKDVYIKLNSTIIFRLDGFVVYPSEKPINLSNINMKNFTIF